MDSLLPSEIARLVLGYLEEQKCNDAARSFLEMSPHLHECRTVTTTGRRFSTRVNGFTLADILEKFCAANAMIQERLSKVSDCQQLKHCGDLLEQLRFLVDGSRGQRFVVNINVPTTSQTSGGSPIISSSMRKRYHSGSERDRSKRAPKSHSQSSGKPSEPVSAQLGCDAVETTPLEHLPGHSGSEKSDSHPEKNFEKSLKERSVDRCTSTVTEAIGSQSLPENRRDLSTFLRGVEGPRSFEASIAKIGLEKQEIPHEKCSAATDTEELMLFTNTEVQTTPYDAAESETELTDEPIENLSLLTKELLNRTELHERIAENINKAILPADISLRDVSLSETLGGEINTSIMTELDNAIKSVVTATESDPVFAKFLDEIIGPNGENDTSPDEDAADHQPLSNILSNVSPEPIAKPITIESSTPYEKKLTPCPETPEVPLKNRLRSSASQQIVRPEEDRATSQKLAEKDTALEDLNAAAILSIINANNKLEEEKRNADLVDATKDIVDHTQAADDATVPTVNPVIPETTNDVVQSNIPAASSTTTVVIKLPRKANARKPRAKSKPKVPEVIPENLISEEEIMAMPTLIVCSKEEMSCFIGVPPIVPNPLPAVGYCASQFLPIAPKTSDKPVPKPEPLYLRTVNVPMKIPKPKEIENLAAAEVHAVPRSKSREERLRPRRSAEPTENSSTEAEKLTQNSLSSVLDVAIEATHVKAAEKITLYGNENSNITVLDETVLPTVNVDETVSVSGTGLSPFLKFNNARDPVNSAVIEKSTDAVDASVATIDTVPMEQVAASTSKQESYGTITKRTPRSLLKSRSKNHRLSLSTPRRRSSHIRALDFNTPTKAMNCSRRMSVNENNIFSSKTCNLVKNVCRTSLFKSPPFAGSSPTNTKKLKSNSPVKDCRPCKIPIATRSPAPKLMGGWEKYTGVGIILGSTSPSSSSSSPVKHTVTTSQKLQKSWDADLRQSLKIAEDLPKVAKKVPPKKPQMKQRGRKKRTSNASVVQIDESSGDFEPDATEPRTRAISITPAEYNKKSHSIEITEEPIDDKTVGSSNENVSQNSLEVMRKSTETVKTVTNNNIIVKSNSVKKKYAQLKTITTNITKHERCENGTEMLNNAMERAEKSMELTRNHPESSQQIMQLPNMLDLETPRKLENNFGIPPTPRLLSPSSSLITPFGLQMGEDSVKVQSFIPTPEFPPTPCIAVTPKQLCENTAEAAKTEKFACSNYYQPSSELKDPRLPKQYDDQSRHDMSLPLPGMMATCTDNRVKNISVQDAQDFQAGTMSNKLEITQFEVIKENLPRDEACKELKISSSASEARIISEASIDPMEIVNEMPAAVIDLPIDDLEVSKDEDKSGSTIDDDSSDSDSSCSSDSSSSTSSSSSSSSSATNTSANITLTKQYTKKPSTKIYTDTSNESVQKTAANVLSAVMAKNSPSKNLLSQEHNSLKTMLVSSRVENESSPTKVFPIVKNEEALGECATETPVKDESLLAEADISETPSSSKAGFDNVTNLTSKISAEESKRNRITETTENPVAPPPRKALPRIISIQRILPDVSVALKPASGNDLCNVMQSRPNPAQQCNAMSNAKLSRQLEEKRLRLMAKFKEKDKTPAYRPRIKRTVAITKAKKRPEKNESIAEEMFSDGSEGKELPRRQSSQLREAEPRVENPRNDGEEEERQQQAANIKTERYKKSQMLKELFDESSLTTTPTKMENHIEMGAVVGVEQVTQLDKSSPTDTRVDKEQQEKIGGSTNDSKPKSRTSQSEESAKPDEVTEMSLAEPKVSKQSTKLDEDVSEELPEKRSPQSPEEAAPQCWEKAKNNKREECIPKEAASTTAIDSKKLSKSKVDLVKRDLFSDEESSDQRTTRSRTRQTCHLPKTGIIEAEIFASKVPDKDGSTTEKEDMPGVLECLDLVPTTKNDAMDEHSNVLDISQRHAEYHFIYDDTVQTKRRKRKFSSSELEFSVEVELTEDDCKTCSKVMTATAYEEIFNLSPPRKKRGPSKESVKTLKYKKKDVTPQNNAKTLFSDIRDKPLATSSPVVKTSASKNSSKAVRSPAKKLDSQQTETKKKLAAVKTDKQSESEKHNPKSRKRKPSVSRDSEQVDKKPRATITTTDPQLLLRKLDLDKFLTTVHGPA